MPHSPSAKERRRQRRELKNAVAEVPISDLIAVTPNMACTVCGSPVRVNGKNLAKNKYSLWLFVQYGYLELLLQHYDDIYTLPPDDILILAEYRFVIPIPVPGRKPLENKVQVVCSSCRNSANDPWRLK